MAKVKCIVKTPKGLWVGAENLPQGSEVEIEESKVENLRKRGTLYGAGEYEALQAAEEERVAAVAKEKAAQARNIKKQEKAAEKQIADEAKAAEKEGDSKGS